MALELRQSLKMSQQLVMTPQLQQAIKLLQLSRLELQQAVREELEVNPVLEEVSDEAPEEAPPQHKDAGNAEDEAPPATKDGLIDRVDWNYYFDETAPQGGRSEREREDEDGRPYYENLLTRKPSLPEYLESQVNLSVADESVRETARYLIGNIDEDGYLKTSTEEAA